MQHIALVVIVTELLKSDVAISSLNIYKRLFMYYFAFDYTWSLCEY